MATVLKTKTDGTQRYSFTTQLDGVTFGLEFSWNARGEYWSFVIYDAAGNPLVRRVVRVSWPLLARFKNARLPRGELVAMDTSGQDLDPGLTELGDGARVQLVYLTAADLAG